MSDGQSACSDASGTRPTGPDSEQGVLDVLLLVTGEDTAAEGLLRAELPHAAITVSSTPEGALRRLRHGGYDAFVEQVPESEGTLPVASLALTGEHLEQPVLAVTGHGPEQAALWSLAHHPEAGGQHGEGAAIATGSLGEALLRVVHDAQEKESAPADPAVLGGILDALEASTCAVAADGLIVFRNSAWRAFASENAGAEQERDDENYLAICDAVGSRPGDGEAASLDRLDARLVAEGLRAVLSHDAESFEREYPCHSPAEERWFSVRITPWDQPHGGAVITHVDITAMHHAQAALNHEVLHDALTGLPNRTLLRDRLRQALLDARRRNKLVGVGFIDLDLFKRINSSLGHQAGDTLLLQVGWRLSRQLRAGDTLSRFGGDEFVVVWGDLDSDEQAHQLAERLTEGLVEPFEIEGVDVSISASVGVATSQGTQTVEDLIQSADVAMYEAKRHGRDRVRTFARDLDHVQRERLGTEAALRTALRTEQLVLHYQPVVHLHSGEVVGLEALVRWDHPTRGLLPPSAFSPIAESSGLIVPLGRWTLQQACSDAARLSGDAARLHVAVNLSVRQLNDHAVVAHVREALSKSRLGPDRLVLEVTESAIMENEDVAALVLEELEQLGVRLAIDDFGTGFSSLLYLRRYPISAIKIDRAFVASLPDSPDDHAICASVVSLAKAVRAISIAEGVETAAQYASLRQMGCQLAQGYLWSSAVPLAELDEALAACREVPRPRAARLASRNQVQLALEPSTRQAMLALLDSGASLHSVAAALNAQGLQTPHKMRWTAAAVARHLHR